MNRIRNYTTIAICLSTLAVTASCGSESGSLLISAAEGGTISSSDSLFTLTIPPGALAEDTEISVSRVAKDDPDRNESSDIAGYILQPSGTVFSEPVEVALVLPLSLLESGFRVLNLATEVSDGPAQDTVVSVEVEDILVSDDGSEATLVMEISHFSRLVVIRVSFFEATVSVPDRVVVGVPFSATVIIRKTESDNDVLSRHTLTAGDDTTVETVTVRRGSDWALTGRFSSHPGGRLSPQFIGEAPPKTHLTSDSFTSIGTFTCWFAGQFEVGFFARISFDESWEYVYTPEMFGILDDHVSSSVIDGRTTLMEGTTGECVAPPPTDTPVPGQDDSSSPGPDELTSNALGFAQDSLDWVTFEQDGIVLRISQIDPIKREVEDSANIYADFNTFSRLSARGQELQDAKLEFTITGPMDLYGLENTVLHTVDSELNPDNKAVLWGFADETLLCLSDGEGKYSVTLTGSLVEEGTFPQAVSLTVSGVITCEEPPPEDEALLMAAVYTIDNRHYDRVQFQYSEGHDGCTPDHIHNAPGLTTVYPYLKWYIRGFPDLPLQTTGDTPLADPAPDGCGFGMPVSLGPPSALIPEHHFLETCDRVNFDLIQPASVAETNNLSRWIERCDELRS